MANPEHLARLEQGVSQWNGWRRRNRSIQPDLRGAILKAARLVRADLSSTDLRGAFLKEAILGKASLQESRLREANLTRAHLKDANAAKAELNGANLSWADARGAILKGANLHGAQLYGANLSASDLSGADLGGANLQRANLYQADLSGADLRGAILVDANLELANLTACSVYGVSAWSVRLEGAIQSNLLITPARQSPIQVDNLEVAQFIYLLLNNQKIRSVIDTITSKVVLILGRFTPDRMAVLEAIREELRKRDYLPVLFNFEKPSSQTTVETVSTLAHMARFVIADLTDAKSVLQELQALVPLSPSVVVQPLLLASQEEPGMFDFIRQFPWVLDTHRYTDQARLLAELKKEVIDPAEAKAKELAQKRQK